MPNTIRAAALATCAACILVPALASAAPDPRLDLAAEKRAEATVRQMTSAEKTVITHGIMPLPLGGNPPPIPADAVPGAGYIAGIERLGIPALKETDASLGVSYVMGLRKDGATALPSGVAQAASWNPDLLRSGGAMIGSEARAKGFNVLLAGGVNLTRDPRNGRTFEYLSEDPLLSGMLVGAAIRGVQSNNIISTIKHFALNGQETARKYVDVKIAEGAARESDLLAFKIGIEQGQPGSVMCAYNKVMGEQACANDWLLNKVLKQSWGYKGFVMSDWGAVPDLGAAIKGLDQQSGAQLDPAVFFADRLAAKAAGDRQWQARLDDMNRRILTAIYATGVDKHPVTPGGKIDFAANGLVSEQAARQGIVLLKNANGALPLAATAKSIALIGGYADGGVLSGAGSSQVHGEGGPVAVRAVSGTGVWASFIAQQYHRSSPQDAIKARAPGAAITFRDGRYITDAVEKARQAQVAIVFATQWMTEGLDVPDLSLPDRQDDLIEAVAAANPNTIVVLETGGPVKMPWLDKVAGVIEAWYPGARGGEAIASVLFGETNPSGRLPITFPRDESQLPRPKLDGSDTVEPSFTGDPAHPGDRLTTDYDIEGSDVGYRWFARKGEKALFPFGYGLSYTTFAASGLKTDGRTASFTVANTGQRPGATVAQLYLVSRGGERKVRLVGFRRLDLAAGAQGKVDMAIDPRLLADWRDGGWSLPGGQYAFALGENAESLGEPVTVKIAARRWKD
ncbi:glycoside hydrolase family 3 C-terminal domain-containing protein [Novosphingobium flavum]|uniref:Glycoside hydrolase family 3 C-terminal domain-containing protein n=1 Tax=Novosphingobium flavum TaxID=1778672 RepID=A0A7X1FRW8_9SPHN|nr:glycoside hydrolase family 3 C-terminal domain-containing protein [Novosphingobium flavum]MBC2665402.1 glycoside hydrolase family 3 C-terminal domain-containing protein [Novosphingobium flavum]